MYWEDHSEPHLHAYYGEHEASVTIESAEISAGALPPRVTRLVKEWIELHREELRENWDRCQRMETPKRILPLI